MALQKIEFGTDPNDGNGDTLRSGAVKINENFQELYGFINLDTEVTFVNSVTAGTGISINQDTGNVIITNTSPNVDSFTTLVVSGQPSLTATSLTQTLTLAAGSNITLTTNPASNTVTIASTQQQVNWDATSGPTAILHKPTIPAAQIQSDFNQLNVNAPDYIKNQPVIFYDIDEMSDINGRLPGASGDYKVHTNTNTLDPSQTKVISVASRPNINGIKAVIQVGGLDPSGNFNLQLAEVMIAKSVPVSGTPAVQCITYGVSYTGGSLLATFTAQYNTMTNFVEIVGTNLSSTGTLLTKVIATDYIAV